jgi:hypothetical protein
MPIMQNGRYAPPEHMIKLTETREDHALAVGQSAAVLDR